MGKCVAESLGRDFLRAMQLLSGRAGMRTQPAAFGLFPSCLLLVKGFGSLWDERSSQTHAGLFSCTDCPVTDEQGRCTQDMAESTSLQSHDFELQPPPLCSERLPCGGRLDWQPGLQISWFNQVFLFYSKSLCVCFCPQDESIHCLPDCYPKARREAGQDSHAYTIPGQASPNPLQKGSSMGGSCWSADIQGEWIPHPSHLEGRPMASSCPWCHLLPSGLGYDGEKLLARSWDVFQSLSLSPPSPSLPLKNPPSFIKQALSFPPTSLPPPPPRSASAALPERAGSLPLCYLWVLN